MSKPAKGCRIGLLACVFVFAQLNAWAQTAEPTKPSAEIVFEVIREGWAHGRISATILRLYKNGRVVYDEASRRGEQEKYRTEKTATSRVAAQKITELISLASRPDFLHARDAYKAYSAGIDAGHRAAVNYFRKSGKQTIELAPYFSRRGETAEALPESLKEFLKKIAEIETLMAGKLRE